jgi:hypothetical protein
LKDIPGARILNIVTIRFDDVSVDDSPLKMSASAVERPLGQRREAEPRAVRAVAGREADVEEDPRREEDPVAEHVEARERHVARTDHQRHEVVAERAGRHRDDEEEDHRDAVHRENLVVDLRREHGVVRTHELRAHEQRFGAARAEQQQRRPEEEQPDAFVIRRRQPAQHSGRGLPFALEQLETLVDRQLDGGHYFSVSR